MVDSDIPSLVFDNGTGLTKAGFSNTDAPRCIFATIVGRPHNDNLMVGMGSKEAYVGDEAQAKRGMLDLSCPIERGIITNFDRMEQIWHHTYYVELRVAPEEQPVLLSEPALNPRENREKMTEVMLETFNAPATYLCTSAVLALYSAGHTTGVVIDSGESLTSTVPIYEGYALPHSILRMDLGGNDLTIYLEKLLNERGYSFSTAQERDIVRKIKQEYCYVASDLEVEEKLAETTMKPKIYTLPDGQEVSIMAETFRCPEAMFQPSKVGCDSCGLPELVIETINKCDSDIRKNLFSNLMLSGGNTMFLNLSERLQKEFNMMELGMHAKIVAPPERKYATWIGGSIISSLPSFNNMWITKEEYLEEGPQVVHKKCF